MLLLSIAVIVFTFLAIPVFIISLIIEVVEMEVKDRKFRKDFGHK